MTIRLHLVPIETVGNRRSPKYLANRNNPVGIPMKFRGMDFGYEPLMLLAGDASDAEHTLLSANADVLTAPLDLQSTPGAGAVTSMQTYLEGYNLPADWINTSLTYAQILKRISVMFQLAQRLNGILGNVRLFVGGVTLSTTLAALPTDVRQALIAAAGSFGWDTSSLTGASTVREALKFAIQAWGIKPIKLGSLEL